MKRLLAISVLLLVMVGCGGVVMNATYSSLLDRSTAMSQEWSDRANGVKQPPLTFDEMKQALKVEAENWTKFKNAKDGVSK